MHAHGCMYTHTFTHTHTHIHARACNLPTSRSQTITTIPLLRPLKGSGYQQSGEPEDGDCCGNLCKKTPTSSSGGILAPLTNDAIAMPASEAVSGQLQMSGSLNANGGTDKGHVSGSLQGSSASATLL